MEDMHPRDCYVIRRKTDHRMFRISNNLYDSVGVPINYEFVDGVYNSSDGKLMRKYWRLPIFDSDKEVA